MHNEIAIRKATKNDIDFIIETIIESEKSSSNTIPSCNAFSLSYEEFTSLLRQVLLIDIKNYDYSLDGFFIADYKGEPIGALGSWLEAVEDNPSSMIKAMVFMDYIDKERIRESYKKTKATREIHIDREKGALQLEHGYVKKEFRRKKVFTKLLQEITRYYHDNYNSDKVQATMFKENFKSFNCYMKYKFEVVEEKYSDNPKLEEIFPYKTRVSVILTKDKFNQLLSYNVS